MEETNQNIESPNSCEISINAKGQYSAKVKVYAPTIDDAVAIAVVKAGIMEELIKTKNG